MIATETNVTTGQRFDVSKNYGTRGMIHAVENVRTERSCACSDFDILHGLRGV